MNPFIKTPHLRSKLPGYGIAKSHALNDSTLQSISTNYRTKFLKSFRYLQGNVIKDIPISNAICSTKRDGISAFFYWEKGKGHVTYHIPSCGVEDSLPFAQELAEALEAAGHNNALILGEMFINGGRRSHSYEVINAIYSPANRGTLEGLHFAFIDVLVLDKQDLLAKTYEDRIAVVQQLPKTKLAYASDFITCNGLDEVNRFFTKKVEAGEEGIVFYDCSKQVVYKAKPQFSIDLAIVGYVEGTDEMAGKVVSVMGGLLRPDGAIQLVARVGITSQDLGDRLMRQLSPHRVKCDYMETDSDNRPIEWVQPTLMVEIQAEEALWEDVDGSPWTTTVLSWQGAKLQYVGQAECIKPFHPVFERMRDDKPVAEATFNQLPKLTEVPSIILPPSPSKAEILKRKVFTKTAKGNVCVKKAVLWHQDQDGMPHYCLHLLEYSPNRGTPLEEKTLVSDWEEELAKALKNWEEEEITKGWIPAGKAA